jgi:hypothetical protein
MTFGRFRDPSVAGAGSPGKLLSGDAPARSCRQNHACACEGIVS